MTPSLGMDWNDNITLTRHDTLGDFILRPLMQFDGSYPISQRNLLRFNIGLGYDEYLSHNQFSALRIESGSEVAFQAYVKDFTINVHDRMQYIQDPAEQAAVAATGRYGGLDNTAGLFTTWDLGDVALTLGYDHQNFVSSTTDFDYLNRASELVFGRVGLRVYPKLVVGLESTGGFNNYDLPVLNDSQAYSAGAYADWRPGERFRVQARGGYVSYLVDQTSRVLPAVDRSTWYADLTVGHKITDVLSYSLSAGHDVRLGSQADTIKEWYVRPAIGWNVIKGLTANTYLSFEHGDQSQLIQSGGSAETYDWLGCGLNFNYSITKKLAVMLRYRLTLRSSDFAAREYSQNLVGVRLSYQIE